MQYIYMISYALCINDMSIMQITLFLSICSIHCIFYFLPERDYVTFGYMPSQIRLSSSVVVVVCNVRAPYSGGWNFPQQIFTILYASRPLTYTQHFTEIVAEELVRWG